VAQRNGGQLLPLDDREAEGLQHELADDPAANFFRVTGPVEAADGRPPLRRGDTLVALEGSPPREGDLIVVQLEGNGFLLGTSRKGGTWCLLTSGAAVPQGAVLGIGWRRVRRSHRQERSAPRYVPYGTHI